MWLLYVSIKKYVQTYSLVWSFLTPVRRLECHNFSPHARTAILAAFSPLQRSHMRRHLTAVFNTDNRFLLTLEYPPRFWNVFLYFHMKITLVKHTRIEN